MNADPTLTAEAGRTQTADAAREAGADNTPIREADRDARADAEQAAVLRAAVSERAAEAGRAAAAIRAALAADDFDTIRAIIEEYDFDATRAALDAHAAFYDARRADVIERVTAGAVGQGEAGERAIAAITGLFAAIDRSSEGRELLDRHAEPTPSAAP